MANQHSVRELLGIVADPETPEARDAAWNSIEEQLETLDDSHKATADALAAEEDKVDELKEQLEALRAILALPPCNEIECTRLDHLTGAAARFTGGWIGRDPDHPAQTLSSDPEDGIVRRG